MTELKTMMDFALEYVAEGFKVIPLQNRGKVPLTKTGLKEATETRQGVKEYWKKWPDANIGLLTQGLVVVDLDVKNGGLQSKTQLIANYGELPKPGYIKPEVAVSTGYTGRPKASTFVVGPGNMDIPGWTYGPMVATS